MKCFRCGTWDGEKCGCKDGQTIFHGDCREILPELPKVDLVLTSPPYNLRGFHQMHNGNSNRWEYDSYGDDLCESEYQKQQKTLCNMLYKVCDGPMFYSHKNRIVNGEMVSPLLWLQKTDWTIHQQVVVTKNSGANVDKRRFFPVHELVFVCLKTAKCSISNTNCLTDVWYAKQSNRKDVNHPAVMNDVVASNCIASSSGETVLDPFLGSGTTLRACKDLGRRGIGIEISENYCQIAAERLRQNVLNF